MLQRQLERCDQEMAYCLARWREDPEGNWLALMGYGDWFIERSLLMSFVEMDGMPVEASDGARHQPDPVPENPEIPGTWSLVIADMEARDRHGRETYGTPLQPENGRYSLLDAYQEQLDHVVYLKNELLERDNLRARYHQALDRIDGLLRANNEELERRRNVETELAFERAARRSLAESLNRTKAAYYPPLTFLKLQEEQTAWADHNFPDPAVRDIPFAFLGVVEEVGELAHSLLKGAQGIRGTPAEHEAKAKDAVGDITVYLADLCRRKEWSYQEIIEDTWNEVKQRDWKKFPKNGLTE